MIHRAVLLLSVVGVTCLLLSPALAAPTTQVGSIYVDPSTGSAREWFIFTGSDFASRTPMVVTFITPTGEIWDLVANPLVTEADGTFRLPILPEQDLALSPGNVATVQLGRWFARFTLDDTTYYEQPFTVLP